MAPCKPMKIPQINLGYRKFPSEVRERYVRETLKEILFANREGITIPGLLMEGIPFTRKVIEKHLESMVAVNEAFKKEFGRSIVYFPNNRAIHSISDTSKKIGNKTFRAVHINNLLGDFLYVQEYEDSAYGEEVKGGLMVELNKVKEFISFLEDVNRKVGEQVKDDKHN